MRLSAVASHLNVPLRSGDCEFTSISTDTRTLRPGQLFVALKGENFDGHNYLQAALQGGACGFICERPLEFDCPHLVVDDSVLALGVVGLLKRNTFAGPVIAVTGSCGKTTVKGMLREILACEGAVVATVGNLNNQIGVPLTLMQLESQDFAVVELGTSSPGEIGYLSNLIQPNVALVTNVAAAHIGGFPDLNAIAEEKSQVYAPLTAAQIAVINGDDVYADSFIRKTGASQQFVFSVGEGRAVSRGRLIRAQNIRLEDGLPRFDLCFEGSVEPIALNVLGRHNVHNALASAACALAVGASLASIRQGLSQFVAEKGRMQSKKVGQALLIDDSYNANPKSVKAAIDYLAEQGALETFLVFGNMAELGDFSKDAHEEIGRYARSRNISGLYAVGDDAALAAKQFGAGGRAFASREEVIEALKPKLSESVTLLVKGSRSARMDDVVKALCKAAETSKC